MKINTMDCLKMKIFKDFIQGKSKVENNQKKE